MNSLILKALWFAVYTPNLRMPKRLSIEVVQARFAAKGLTLVSTSYEKTSSLLAYKCRCGNSKICQITLNGLALDRDNCNICIQERRKKNNMEKYGTDHHMKSSDIKIKIKETCMAKYGVDHPMKVQEVRDKFNNTMIERYGKKHALQVDEFKNKAKDTSNERFGVNYPSQNEQIKEKKKNTFIENYGVDHPLKNTQVKEQMKQTCIDRYGKYYTQTEEMKDKSRQTCMARYGVEYAMQSAKIYSRYIETCQLRYGVDHPMQVADFAYKASMSAYSLKEFEFPSEEIVFVQGYEPICLAQLLSEGITESDLLDGFEHLPTIWYTLNNKKHRYYPDIFIPSKNLLIEVKSAYLYERDKERIIIKLGACVSDGYNAELRIYTSGHELDQVIYFPSGERL